MGYVLSCGSTVRAAAHIHDSHSHTPCNSKSTQILWNLPHVRAQSHATKRYLAVERPQVTRVERIGPVLFCAACSCVAANHSLDISRHKLLTKWRTAWSPILKARNRQEYTPPCIVQYRIYTSMDISAKLIAAAMGKARDDKCEVVGQDQFASPTGCCLSTVAHVCKVLWQATATLTSWCLWLAVVLHKCVATLTTTDCTWSALIDISVRTPPPKKKRKKKGTTGSPQQNKFVVLSTRFSHQLAGTV